MTEKNQQRQTDGIADERERERERGERERMLDFRRMIKHVRHDKDDTTVKDDRGHGREE